MQAEQSPSGMYVKTSLAHHPSVGHDSASMMRRDPPPSGEHTRAFLMPRDRTKDNERFVHMLKGRIDQFALSLASSDTKNYIQQLVIEPFLQYIIQRFFPYLIIALCIFSGMLILVILTFVLQLMNRNSVCSMCSHRMG
jgi:hypothetical protein